MPMPARWWNQRSQTLDQFERCQQQAGHISALPHEISVPAKA
jgi:hypothetical protein